MNVEELCSESSLDTFHSSWTFLGIVLAALAAAGSSVEQQLQAKCCFSSRMLNEF